MLCEDWSNLLMQSELQQDETRLWAIKGKNKTRQPTPQEERVHHQHVLKKNRSACVFSCLTLPLLQLYPNEANESGSLDYYQRSKVIFYFFCLAAVSPDKELRLSFVFKHLSRKLNFFPLSLSFSLQGHLIIASAIQSHHNTTGVIAMVMVIISSCMSPHASNDLTCLKNKNILGNSNFSVVCLFVSA